jgi:hypothetical protein
MDLEACGQSGGGELDFFFGKSANHCVMRSGGNKIDLMRFDNWASVQIREQKKTGSFLIPLQKLTQASVNYVFLSDSPALDSI